MEVLVLQGLRGREYMVAMLDSIRNNAPFLERERAGEEHGLPWSFGMDCHPAGSGKSANVGTSGKDCRGVDFMTDGRTRLGFNHVETDEWLFANFQCSGSSFQLLL